MTRTPKICGPTLNAVGQLQQELCILFIRKNASWRKRNHRLQQSSFDQRIEAEDGFDICDMRLAFYLHRKGIWVLFYTWTNTYGGQPVDRPVSYGFQTSVVPNRRPLRDGSHGRPVWDPNLDPAMHALWVSSFFLTKPYGILFGLGTP